MTAIGVIGCAGAFSGDHRGAERMFGRALPSERLAVVGLFYTSEHESADARCRLLGVNFLDFEQSLGVVVAELVTQFIAALRDRADTAPFAVADIEHFVDQILRDAIAVASDDA